MAASFLPTTAAPVILGAAVALRALPFATTTPALPFDAWPPGPCAVTAQAISFASTEALRESLVPVAPRMTAPLAAQLYS